MTTSPACRCLSCGRLFCYVPGFTPTRTRCYLCGPEPQGAARDDAQHDDEGQAGPPAPVASERVATAQEGEA